MFNRAIAVGTILTLLSLNLAAEKPKPKSDKEQLQGSWQGTKLEVNGQTAPANIISQGKYVFKENKLTIFNGDKNDQESDFTLDPDKDPKTIDLVATSGPAKGKKMLGIYKIKDDVLTLCIGEDRPKEFSGAGKAGLLEFKRQKETK